MTPTQLLATKTELLARFPKTRPPLPPEYAAAHANFYRAAREGGHAGAAIALRLERWMHRQAAGSPTEMPLLEIGAGTLNHVNYEPADGAYDVVEPLAMLYDGKPERGRLRDIFSDCSEIPADRKYRRIISIAVLEHVTDLPRLLARTALMLDDGGQMIAGIPSEGGFLWGAAWRCGTAPTFRRQFGLSYAKFVRHEHINDAAEIEELIKLFYSDVRINRFPAPHRHLSFYTNIRCMGPRVGLAREYLTSNDGP